MCECADFDSGVDEPSKGISLKFSVVSALGWVAARCGGDGLNAVWRAVAGGDLVIGVSGSVECARAVLLERVTRTMDLLSICTNDYPNHSLVE